MYWSQFPAFETGMTGILALVIWLGYLGISWKRLSGPQLGLRGGLLAAVLFCLCCIICQPQYTVLQPAGKALVLTEPVRSVPDSVPVFALPSAMPSANVTSLSDLGMLERNYPAIEEVYIDGYGLEPEQLRLLKRLKVRFVHKNAPSGFHWLAYNATVHEGESLRVSGSYQNDTQDSLKIRLLTTEGASDSAMLAPGKVAFALQARHKTTGRYVGTVQVISGSQTRHEPLPYQVQPKQSLRISLVQAFPSFEANYLKDWLISQKHQVRIQVKVSKEAVAAQQINTVSKEKTALLSASALAKTDLLILDDESLQRLSAAEQAVVKRAITQGLGLLLLPQERWVQQPTVLGQRFGVRTTGVKQFVPEISEGTARSEVEKIPFSLVSTVLTIPVWQSREHEVIAAYQPLGGGRVGIELATNTFTWLLSGEEQIYSHCWTNLIQALSRRQKQHQVQPVSSPFLWEGSVGNLSVTDSMPQPARITYVSGVREMIQPVQELTQGIMYPIRPAASGWLSVYTGNDSTQAQPLYVMPSSAWLDLHQNRRWRQYPSTGPAIATTDSMTTANKAIPLIWFFIPLLAFLGTLWWVEKTQKA